MNFEDRFRNMSMNNAQERDRYQHHELISDRDHEVDQSNTDDIVYYNFEVQNDPSQSDDKVDPELGNPINTEAKDLVFDINRVEPILKVPSDYEYAVERFSCPSTFPIYLEDIDNYPLMIRIVLRDTVTGNIIFNSESSYVLVYNPLIPELPPDIPQTNNLIKNGIYDYESIVSAVNGALRGAVDTYNQQDPLNYYIGLVGIGPIYPFMRYFQQSGNFTLYAPTENSSPDSFFNLGEIFPVSYPSPASPTNNPVVEIQFNDNLASLFSGLFSWQTTDPGWKTMVIRSRLGSTPFTWNGNTYYSSTTQYDIRPAMEQFKKIIFSTSSVPVRDELLGEQRNVIQRKLFDYVLSNRLNNKQNINFFPNYLKWNNLEAENEMRRINMNVDLEYRDGTLYPLKLQPGEIFNCKLVFRKKKTTKVKEVSRIKND